MVSRRSSLVLIQTTTSLDCTRQSREVSTALGRYAHHSIMHVWCPHDRRHFRQANAIGRSSKTVREFLEKNHKDDMSRDDTIKLTVKSLLEVVQTGAKNIEISVMESYGKITVCYPSSRRFRIFMTYSPNRASIWPRLRPLSRRLRGRKRLVCTVDLAA